MTNFRPYRNTDSPALAALWNRGAPPSAVAAPLSTSEFDARVVGGPLFDARGLTVAEHGGRLVGFAHAGFGPDDSGRPLRLGTELGTVGVLVVEPGLHDPALEDGLLASAEGYLRGRGAKVLYAGGQAPLNPYYWGVYGGSEWSGVLGGHAAFHRALARAGYEPVSRTALLEADLSRPEARDPRAVLIRRQVQFEAVEDDLPGSWWEALAVGEFRPTTYRLRSRADGTELARASAWDMTWFGRRDGRTRSGLYAVEVAPEHRRKGLGRHLVNEILRAARAQATAAVAVQTPSTNLPALALYQSVGFDEVEIATLYRRPG